MRFYITLFFFHESGAASPKSQLSSAFFCSDLSVLIPGTFGRKQNIPLAFGNLQASAEWVFPPGSNVLVARPPFKPFFPAVSPSEVFARVFEVSFRCPALKRLLLAFLYPLFEHLRRPLSCYIEVYSSLSPSRAFCVSPLPPSQKRMATSFPFFPLHPPVCCGCWL